MPRHRGLSVIGEHFDHALIDEDPQGQVFSLFQFKRWFDIPNVQNLTLFARRNREAAAPVFGAQDLDPKITGRWGVENKLQFHRVARHFLQQVFRIALHRDVPLLLRIAAELFEFAQGLDAQHAILRKAELTGQRLYTRLNLLVPFHQRSEIANFTFLPPGLDWRGTP